MLTLGDIVAFISKRVAAGANRADLHNYLVVECGLAEESFFLAWLFACWIRA